MRFMRRDWTKTNVEVLKTKVRIGFSLKREIDGELYQDSRTTEYELNPHSTIEHVIEDQQKTLYRDVRDFVGGAVNMDELLETLVG